MVDGPGWPPQKPLRTGSQRPPGRVAFCRVCGPVDLTLLEEDASTARDVFFGLRHIDRPASLRYLTPLRVGVPFSDETFAGPNWGLLPPAATKPPLGLVASSGPPNTSLHLQGAPQRLAREAKGHTSAPCLVQALLPAPVQHRVERRGETLMIARVAGTPTRLVRSNPLFCSAPRSGLIVPKDEVC
jgi:hypothetical protein